MDLPDAEILDQSKKRVGTSLRGKYLIECLIGVGAMGAVYEGTHRNGMRAAVKVLHPWLSRIPVIKKRFLREGYIANRIDHPGVVRIIDDDEDADGAAFIVMELLHGRTVEAEWAGANKKLPLDRVVQIADSLLDILDAAHAAGVVHRDVKPDNVFATQDGRIKVLDFGIARLVDNSSRTPAGQTMGTPEFVAPEQASGRVSEIDARTDIFSVGAVMFTLLSGEYTQSARTSVEHMIYAATRPAPSIVSVMPDLPPDVAHVIDVSLSFERDGRFSSARAMQNALRAAMGMSERTSATNVASVPSAKAVPASRPEPSVSGTSTLPAGSLRSADFPKKT
jgi:serine/threonine-protein kinase